MSLPEFETQHILLISEDEHHRQRVREAVGELPYLVHVSAADNGEDGIKMLKDFSNLPDLLFLDLELSSKNGLECLREIKTDHKLHSLPILIFSTSSYPAVVNEAYDTGAHLYIPKLEPTNSIKKLIQHLLSINWKEKISPPPREEFVVVFKHE